MNKQSATRSNTSASKTPPPPPMAPVAKKSNPASGSGNHVDGDARRAMIAQGAYFRAEHRGFAAGFELDDWLQAEREIAHMLDA